MQTPRSAPTGTHSGVEGRSGGIGPRLCAKLFCRSRRKPSAPAAPHGGWSLATVREIENHDGVQARIRDTLQLRPEDLGRQHPACQCGLLSQEGQAMVRHLALELALVATDGDSLALLQALATRNLLLADPAPVVYFLSVPLPCRCTESLTR